MHVSRLMALVSGLGCVTLAQAASSAELSWQGMVGCPDREELVYRIERALGGPLARSAPLHFEVQVAPSRSGVEARLNVTGGATQADKERVVSAPDCDKLVDAVALTVALALGAAEPEAHADGKESVLSTTAGPQTSTAEVTSQASANDLPVSDDGTQAGSEEHGVGPTPGVSLWLIGDTGSLPSAGLGAAFGLELSWHKIQLRALGTLLFEQHAEAGTLPDRLPGAGSEDAGADPGADLGLALGSLGACAAPYGSFRSPQSIALCAGWELGRLSGTGTDVPQPRSGGALWLAPRVELGGLWALPGTQLRLGGFLVAAAPLNRAQFALRDLGPIHRASSVVGRVSLGAVWVLE
jgi:hypothetical protein